MDLEAEKLYHQYVEKKADKLRAVRREKLLAQRRAKAKILEQLKAESAPTKAKVGAKVPPALTAARTARAHAGTGRGPCELRECSRRAHGDADGFIALDDGQAKPVPKPALNDAKLDDEAQKDYQKFIALKQRKVRALPPGLTSQVEAALALWSCSSHYGAIAASGAPFRRRS